jgi:tetratricopeptide (TPR) repeat protein
MFFGPMAAAGSAYVSYTCIGVNTSADVRSALQVEALLLSGLAVFHVYASVAFFRRSAAAPGLVISLLIARALYSLIDFGMATLAAKQSPEPSGLIGSFLVAGIWVPYLLRSKRVKTTFVVGGAKVEAVVQPRAVETAADPASAPPAVPPVVNSDGAEVNRQTKAPATADEPITSQPPTAALRPTVTFGGAHRWSPVWPFAAVLLAAASAGVYALLTLGATASRSTLSPDAVFARVSPAVVQVVIQDRHNQTIGTGTGFLVSRNGLIATNYHVIEKAHAAQIVLSDKTLLPVAGVVAWDEEADLAIVQVAGQVSALPLELSKGDLPQVGAKVFAIGNPEGLTHTLSDGLVSAHRIDDRFTLIQTTAPISHGSSGGPLLAADGTVVGVTTAFLQVGQNLNFAVPASHVAELLVRCKDETHLTRLPLPAESEPRTFIKRGNACLEKGEYDRAIAEFSEAIRLDPTSPYAHTCLGLAWSLKKDYGRAFLCYDEAIGLDPAYSYAYTRRGYAWIDKKEFDRAIRDFDEAIRLDPKDVYHAYYQRGYAWFRKGNFNRSIQDFEAANRLDPESTPTHYNHIYALAYYMRGMGRQVRKDFDGAIEDYTLAMRLNPKSALHYFNRGSAWFHKHEFDKAVRDYDQAIRLEPKNATHHLFRGLAFMEKSNYDAAIRDFDSCITLDPRNALAFSRRGDAWLAKEDYDQAIRDYDQAVRLDPVAARWVDQNRRIAWSRRMGR